MVAKTQNIAYMIMELMKNIHRENNNLQAAIKSVQDDITTEMGYVQDTMKSNIKFRIDENQFMTDFFNREIDIAQNKFNIEIGYSQKDINNMRDDKWTHNNDII